MKEGTGIWESLWKLICGGIITLLAILVVFCFVPLFQEAQSLRLKNAQLLENNRIKAEELRKLETERSALTTDPKAVEKVAREKLGLAKPNEVIYRFETLEPVTNTSAAKKQAP